MPFVDEIMMGLIAILLANLRKSPFAENDQESRKA